MKLEFHVIITKVVKAEDPHSAVEQSAAIVPNEIIVEYLGEEALHLDSDYIERMIRERPRI